MATLEMVPLRSRYPNTGRVTLRYAMPPFDPTFELDAALRDVLDKTTTPQVVELSEGSEDETAARKGGEAR